MSTLKLIICLFPLVGIFGFFCWQFIGRYVFRISTFKDDPRRTILPGSIWLCALLAFYWLYPNPKSAYILTALYSVIILSLVLTKSYELWVWVVVSFGLLIWTLI